MRWQRKAKLACVGFVFTCLAGFLLINHAIITYKHDGSRLHIPLNPPVLEDTTWSADLRDLWDVYQADIASQGALASLDTDRPAKGLQHVTFSDNPPHHYQKKTSAHPDLAKLREHSIPSLTKQETQHRPMSPDASLRLRPGQVIRSKIHHQRLLPVEIPPARPSFNDDSLPKTASHPPHVNQLRFGMSPFPVYPSIHAQNSNLQEANRTGNTRILKIERNPDSRRLTAHVIAEDGTALAVNDAACLWALTTVTSRSRVESWVPMLCDIDKIINLAGGNHQDNR